MNGTGRGAGTAKGRKGPNVQENKLMPRLAKMLSYRGSKAGRVRSQQGLLQLQFIVYGFFTSLIGVSMQELHDILF
jgi:hypothetical protein